MTGVKQGDPLLATLFNMVIDDILKQLELRGNILTFIQRTDQILLNRYTNAPDRQPFKCPAHSCRGPTRFLHTI
jgi:hypothetical protein